MHDPTAAGWSWFHQPDPEPAPGPDPAAELALALARCLGGSDGTRVVAWLRASTLERVLGPEAGEAQLRHLEGQRQLVSLILALAERGRSLPAAGTAHA